MKVVVVGGGITGLATAWFLQHDHSADVTLVEGAPEVGGKLQAAPVGDAMLDLGADSFLARQPHVADLARRVGLGDDLVAPTTSRVLLWTRGALRPLPAGTVLGVPTEIVPMLRSGALTPAGVARAALDLVAPREAPRQDRSVGDLVAERFGHEVVEVLVDPLLGGVYAGDPYRLSVRATTPILAEAASEGGSLLRALRRRRRKATSDGPMFLTLRDGGMARLARTLGDGLDDVVTADPAQAVAAAGDGVEVRLASDRVIAADRAVLAVPAHDAATLVQACAPETSERLRSIEYATVATMALQYRRDAVGHQLDGSGLLVPSMEGRTVKAVTFISSKWPHHAREEHVLLRASVGRAGGLELPSDDDQLVAEVHGEVAEMLDVIADPVATHVTRWQRSLPQFAVGHLELVRDIRDGLAEVGPVHVVGAAYDGVGVASCVAAAQSLAQQLGERGA